PQAADAEAVSGSAERAERHRRCDVRARRARALSRARLRGTPDSACEQTTSADLTAIHELTATHSHLTTTRPHGSDAAVSAWRAPLPPPRLPPGVSSRPHSIADSFGGLGIRSPGADG